MCVSLLYHPVYPVCVLISAPKGLYIWTLSAVDKIPKRNRYFFHKTCLIQLETHEQTTWVSTGLFTSYTHKLWMACLIENTRNISRQISWKSHTSLFILMCWFVFLVGLFKPRFELIGLLNIFQGIGFTLQAWIRQCSGKTKSKFCWRLLLLWNLTARSCSHMHHLEWELVLSEGLCTSRFLTPPYHSCVEEEALAARTACGQHQGQQTADYLPSEFCIYLAIFLYDARKVKREDRI